MLLFPEPMQSIYKNYIINAWRWWHDKYCGQLPRKKGRTQTKLLTWVFHLFRIYIAYSYSELCKMAPSWSCQIRIGKLISVVHWHVIYSSRHSNIKPGRSLSWLATQRNNERWLETSHPWGYTRIYLCNNIWKKISKGSSILSYRRCTPENGIGSVRVFLSPQWLKLYSFIVLPDSNGQKGSQTHGGV